MSTLSAARADNFYYPGEWDPSVESLKKVRRHKGRNQYETRGVIRLEIPFHCWCAACGRHIAKGTRFNAKKERAGKYHTTSIWRFAFGCSCGERLGLRTDPRGRDYACEDSLRRRLGKCGDEFEEVGDALSRGEDDVGANRLARRSFRAKRKAEDALEAEAKRLGLAVELLPSACP
ncbi:hypothetical protein CTAYLR_008837 [Chrysophaeum taylorii]|uniref:Uncharacterized protein n=1 Tax=Chrysophaeum taylorii TaxID=2483200 RepID=A0AAD7U8T4_9STRA|nr:hypothetical protein CTAYLR_008837 [Chrysophaeum taylorii]